MCTLLIGAPLAAVLVAVALVAGPVAISPISWLPEAGKSGTLLGTLLTAQAAIAALTLAVTLFVLQGASGRRDADDRMYREYVRRSWVRRIFWGSLIAVGITGVVLLTESFVGAGELASADTPDLRNLALLAPCAFFVNVVLAGLLFERATHVAQPEHWRTIRRHVNERDVREAVQVFLGRLRRAAAARKADDPDLSVAVPDPGEGSANEAVRALLDDGRRAMDERRREEFTKSLDSIKGLVMYAMDEIEGAGVSWAGPGSHPEWPPLKEFGRNVYSFREEVIRRGDRYEVAALVSLDLWAVKSGITRDCGELFTVGLDGYRRNYEIANRIGERQLPEIIRGQFWQAARLMYSESSLNKAYPYAREMVNHQERLLAEAMHADHPTDFERLHNGFETFLRTTGEDWGVAGLHRPETQGLYQRLAQGYRIALMGLGGRAVLVAESGRIADPRPYLEVVRGKYVSAETLAADIAHALNWDGTSAVNQWLEWEMEDADDFEVQSVSPENYPLTWFAVRLMELSTESLQTLDLHGSAQRVLGWFRENSRRLESQLGDTPAPAIEERREFAIAALEGAVRNDEVVEDYEIIGYDLSEERVSAFRSDVYAAASGPSSIEGLFERVGTTVDLASDADESLNERAIFILEHKGFLADLPANASINYARLDGDEWGRSLADDLIRQFCDVLDETPPVTASLNSAQELVRAIDEATGDLNPSSESVIVLAGNWRIVLSELDASEPDGYIPQWQIPEDERVGDVGQYRNNPIFRGPADKGRRLYVVDLGSWGYLLRAQIEDGYHILVKISTVSRERARELLTENPRHFASEPDEASKVRKLQTHVEILVRARRELRVADASRARRIVGVS